MTIDLKKLEQKFEELFNNPDTEKEFHKFLAKKGVCVHPFETVISAGALHNCTLCGKNIKP